jgi:hypothetical protein
MLTFHLVAAETMYEECVLLDPNDKAEFLGKFEQRKGKEAVVIEKSEVLAAIEMDKKPQLRYFIAQVREDRKRD